MEGCGEAVVRSELVHIALLDEAKSMNVQLRLTIFVTKIMCNNSDYFSFFSYLQKRWNVDRGMCCQNLIKIPGPLLVGEVSVALLMFFKYSRCLVLASLAVDISFCHCLFRTIVQKHEVSSHILPRMPQLMVRQKICMFLLQLEIKMLSSKITAEISYVEVSLGVCSGIDNMIESSI